MKYIGKRKANLLFIVIVLLTTTIMLYNLERHTDKLEQLYKQKTLQEAIAHFDNILVTRSWNAMYGGVFVKLKPGLKPNPYLENNSLKDEQGNILVKINPAWMTRQISALSNQKSHYHYKITSLKPVNPSNKADQFETEALNYFESHKNKKYYYRFSKNKASFDFMGALKTETECLVCHEKNGYKIGDIRGGIRVSIPTHLLQKEIQFIHQQGWRNRFYIILSAIIILFVFYRFLTMVYQHHQEIDALNIKLEAKIKQRTHRLEKMYQHEKYIKDLLKTVTGVNELLLTSISVQNVLKSSADELVKHKHYRFTWIGLIKEGQLEVSHKSDTHLEIIEKAIYDLNNEIYCKNVAVALEAIEKSTTIMKPYEVTGSDKQYNPRADGSHLYWQLAIPLRCHEQKKPFGVFNIHSDRKQGFEAEEIELLERLSVDMCLILYSHKQQAILEKMELDRISNYEETILAFVNIIEQRDTYTAGHTLRVAAYCKIIASALGINKDDIKKLEQAAVLHDIGKVATPDAVLLKPGELTPLEYDLIKQHAYAGFNMLSKIDMYKDLADIIRYHHVHYDGNGYPKTTSPDDVPFLSHIMVIADAFDAMTTHRIYRPRLTIHEALIEIKAGSGSQFHPKITPVALEVLKDIYIEPTSQIPQSDLEQKRFSYFFCDGLTGVHNESYLQIVLSNTERKQNCLYLILLSNFSQYNKCYSWEQGNKLLIAIAKTLEEKFPQAMVFRYHGDDFILLLENHLTLDFLFLEPLFLLKNNNLKLSIAHFDLTSIDYSMVDIYEKLNIRS